MSRRIRFRPPAKALSLEVQDDAAADARAGSGVGAEQREVRPGSLQPRITAGKAQHRGDRSRAEHADGGAGRRIQSRRRCGRSTTSKPKSAASSSATPRASSRKRRARKSFALLEQGKDAGVSFGKPVTLTRNQAAAWLSARSADQDISRPTRPSCRRYVGSPTERRQYSIYKVLQVIDAAGRRTPSGSRPSTVASATRSATRCSTPIWRA